MWIVLLALKRPYTVLVMALGILIAGLLTLVTTSKDIFPAINIPVVTIVWSYQGLRAQEIEHRIMTISERAMTTTVNNIEHQESTSMLGVGVIKVFFYPGTEIGTAVAQIGSIMETLLHPLPPGITPPLILQYDASSVPILQLGVSSDSESEQTLYDLGLNTIRTGLATVQGASIPLPYGGKARQVEVDLNIDKMNARGITPAEVANGMVAQNFILGAGTIKMGTREYNVSVNNSPKRVEDLNDMPIKAQNGAVIHSGDVGQVRDGYAPQTNIVLIDGKKSSLITILKNGKASTLDVVNRIKAALPHVTATLPSAVKVDQLSDQSIFVKAALQGVLKEGGIAALLTAVMILVFLGSWRSTLIVMASIPLAVLVSITVLGLHGETLNIMTLGGLSLAVGILVDDATVEIENIHRNLEMDKRLTHAILDGASQIAVPTFVATLSICIVFVSVMFLNGPAYYLFVPLAESVVFAMLASYLLSRTLVPVMARLLLAQELRIGHKKLAGSWSGRVNAWFNKHFERFKNRYAKILREALNGPVAVLVVFGVFVLITGVVGIFVGEDFFPVIDAGVFRLHIRCPTGTRVEETERVFTEVDKALRKIVPASKIARSIANIGLPANGVSLAFGDNSNIGNADGELLLQLKEGEKMNGYLDKIRSEMARQFPEETFYFQPADIVNQILNFGLPAPIDIQISGRDPRNLDVANLIVGKLKKVRGAADVHLHQIQDAPNIDLDIDRDKAALTGITLQNVANSVLLALSGSGQTQPSFWLDPKNGVSYNLAVQAPQYDLYDINTLLKIPVYANNLSQPQLLGNFAKIGRSTSPQIVSHYNVQPLYDVYANVADRDLGGVYWDLQSILKDARGILKNYKGSAITVRGQAQSMVQSMVGLLEGICFAFVLVYLLMVINFQSLIDPLIIISALPGALCGVVWGLFITQTTFNVPSRMGSIMCLGVATANSILVVTFARERQLEGDSPFEAALIAGETRLRPVLMTASAMIIGMIPMSLGLGEGGEQNAPLGRAVIGGLMVATVTTLFVVPVIYSIVRKKWPDPSPELDRDDESLPSGGHHEG
jgi:multidrug efflux pump subunit AcrB